MFTGRCKSSFACFQLRRFHAGASTMEEGKLFLSVTVLNCHDYIFFQQKKLFQVKRLKIKPFSASYNGYERDISSISLIVDDRLWFHFLIQTGDLPSFLQILHIQLFVYCGHKDIDFTKNCILTNFNSYSITGEKFVAIRQGQNHF